MKARKKPVVVDVLQWTGKNHREMFDFLTGYQKQNEFMTAYGDTFYINHDKVKGGLIIRTLEAVITSLRVFMGSFIHASRISSKKTYEVLEDDYSM